jgi:hypothetical protein
MVSQLRQMTGREPQRGLRLSEEMDLFEGNVNGRDHYVIFAACEANDCLAVRLFAGRLPVSSGD